MAPDQTDVAVIGMSCRFPGARNVEEFWKLVRDGREPITVFTREELIGRGVPPEVADHPDYVRSEYVLDDIELFDASFFGYSPREAAVIDPQNRLFLECAWEALESAGVDTMRCTEVLGVYGGSSTNSYVIYNLLPHREELALEELHPGIHKDFLTTAAAYKLNLRGPSVSVQSFCSTSLLAVHLAVQAILGGECDMAVAGGSSIKVPHRVGYRYRPEGIQSPDGRCRAFDHRARGTPFSNGVGVIVLKQAARAIADGDVIHAIIKGSAANNDGGTKASYMVPSVDGQAEVVSEAIACAGISADTITYVEAHGTGTPIGDPIEIRALTRAFRESARRNGYCAIGSLKTQVGHLDAASGIGGLIKTILALEHGQIPPSLHFERANPEIDFDSTPFFVNTALRPWPVNGTPRRAGVSSVGGGGTNVHAVLEEPPPREPGAPAAWHALPLSARTPAALEAMARNLAAFLRARGDVDLADVAWTLQTGRREFNDRRVVVCAGIDEAIAALEQHGDPVHQERRDRAVSIAMQPLTAAERARISDLGDSDPAALLRAIAPDGEGDPVVVTVGAADGDVRFLDATCGEHALWQTAARLWLEGVRIDWRAAHRGARRLRVALPTYPFERQRYWSDPVPAARTKTAESIEWIHTPLTEPIAAPRTWWIFADAASGVEQASRLAAAGERVHVIDSTGVLSAASLDELRGTLPAPDEILFCRALDVAAAAERALPEAGAMAERLWEDAALLGAGLFAWNFRGTLRLLTRGAQPIEGKPRFAGVLQAPLWQDALAVGGPRIVLLDLDPQPDADESSRLFEELRRPADAGRVALRGGIRRVAGRSSPAPAEPMLRVRAELPTPFRAPATPTERTLASIWSVTLGVAQVGADDDFFALGGDSLIATRIAARIRDQFRAELSLRTVLSATTVASLAAAIDDAVMPALDTEREELTL